jgi:hypothetical protein
MLKVVYFWLGVNALVLVVGFINYQLRLKDDDE